MRENEVKHSSKNATEEEFRSWLRERMKESRITATEALEFTTWLAARSCENKYRQQDKNGSVQGDLSQLFSWVKKRLPFRKSRSID